MRVADLPRLWRTVSHLRSEQLWGRVRYRLARPKPDLSAPPPWRPVQRPWAGGARRAPSLTGPATFRVLGTDHALDDGGWDAPDLPKLLRYNLHYFDDLAAQGAATRRGWHDALIARWITENPPGSGSGWEPYPTSLRIVNWVKCALDGHPLPPEAQASLAVQTRFLMQRLERHLLGNHLFVNAKALIFAGLAFEGPEARHWLETGAAILRTEIPEQILADGGQFELSPMYHALAFEDVLDLVAVARAWPDAFGDAALLETLAAQVAPMEHWLATMSHPDGDISFFNDAAIGIAPPNDELAGFARRLGFAAPAAPGNGITDLAASGYIRLAQGPAVVLADVAAVGPDYLPAHAHADTLSFEMSLYGERIVVNGGTSVYGTGPERQRQRGTAAHSTLQIGETDSSEVWGGFRTGARARVFDRELRNGPPLSLVAAHDGYSRLPGRPWHRRAWRLEETGLTVEDRVTGTTATPITIRFHLAPEIEAGPGPDGLVLSRNGVTLAHVASTRPDRMRLGDGTWHPAFGKSVENRHVLIGPLAPGDMPHCTTFRWGAR